MHIAKSQDMFQKQTCEHMRNITYFKEAAVEIQ